MNFLEKIRGYKKITAAILGLIIAVLCEVVGVEPTVLAIIEGFLGTYIVGQSYTDAHGYNPTNEVKKLELPEN